MTFKSLFVLKDRTYHKPPFAIFCLNFALTFFLLSLLFYAIFHHQVYDFSSIWEYKALFIQGWETTVWLSATSLGLSFLIGLLTALLRRSRIFLLRYLSIFYVEFIRGTPLLVQILFFFYVVANQIGIENRYLVGIITLSLFSGAYMAEMIRSGIEAISLSQWESAEAIGLTKRQTYQFVIFPQVFRQILPPLTGQFASLIKDSSLLSIIGINELTHNAQQVNSATYSTLESFLPLAIGYLILTLPISLFSKYLENRYNYEA